MVHQPTPARFPTNNLYTPMDGCCRPESTAQLNDFGRGCDLRII